MATISLQKAKIERENGIVILPVREYQKLLERSAPAYYLSGKEGSKLDKLVVAGVKEHKAGKTKKIRSFADLD